MKRHVLRMQGQCSNETVGDVSNLIASNKSNLVEVFKTTNLMQYDELFRKDNIDLEMLQGLSDFIDMFKELGLMSWGYKLQLKKALRSSIDTNDGTTNED